uniref:hypothetical protein n=1 Tax=Candidatus Fimivicinus sp. TaxID=3056640 RepID=UPI003FF0C195
VSHIPVPLSQWFSSNAIATAPSPASGRIRVNSKPAKNPYSQGVSGRFGMHYYSTPIILCILFK